MKQVFIALSLFFSSLHATIFLDERFESLERWEHIAFEKIPRQSTYALSSDGLLLSSDNSASALRLNKTYDAQMFPLIEMRWKATQCDIQGNPQHKEGDDYPLRLYVAWEYDPNEATFSEKVLYNLLKLFYGTYPPKAALTYVISPYPIEAKSFVSPYTDKVHIVPLADCQSSLNSWNSHRINILKDYETFFGAPPRGKVTLGIMADSDNTQGKSEGVISSIIVRSHFSIK